MATLDRPYDWLPHYPRPVFGSDVRTAGTRTPISPLSASGSIASFARERIPSAPVSAFGSPPSSPMRSAAQPHSVSPLPHHYRLLQTRARGSRSSRGSRYSGSISSRGSFGVATTGEVVRRPEIVRVPVRASRLSLSAEALRDLDDEQRPRADSSQREPYTLAYDNLAHGRPPPVEPKVLVGPTHRMTDSQSSIAPLMAQGADPAEMPSPPPQIHRRSVPLMEAVQWRLSVPSQYSLYNHEHFSAYSDAVELEGDACRESHAPPTSLMPSQTAPPVKAGSRAVMAEKRHTRNFSRTFTDPVSTFSRKNTEPEKGEWYLHRSSAEIRRNWMIIAALVLLCIVMIIAATVGGVLGSKKKS
ncbi:hypothetical protein LTR53_002141 [Teratosphaeriaceae sp. CCFEE 6253]|nr:hypothetical protein LTR53_002141 [Teratosphaeriaceae sp. CCFEE 6253]